MSDEATTWPWWRQFADIMQHLAVPLLVGLIGSLAGLSRYLHASLLEETSRDYLLTARAKGCSQSRAMWRHAMPNALLPVITLLGLSIPGLIGGSVIIESLFAIPGMGKLFYDSVLMRDMPTIMAIVTAGAFLTLLGNVLADIGYALADPRTRRNS